MTSYADSVGGRQEVQVFEPADTPTVVLGMLPALGIRASYYERFAAYLAERGYLVALTDLPGHGLSPIRASRRNDWGYREVVEVHAEAVFDMARAQAPGAPFVWVAHSIGAQMALMHAGLRAGRDHGVAGVAFVAAGTPYYACWVPPQSYGFLVMSQTTRPIRRLVGHFPGEQLKFGGREAQRLMGNWAKVVRSGSYTFSGFDGDALLRRCEAPILAVTIEGDDWAPPSSRDHLIAKTSSRTVVRRVWDNPDGSIDHNRWPRTWQPPADIITSWLQESGIAPAA